MVDSLPFVTRLWFAFVCFFRVLFDAAFAARAFAAREAQALPELSEAPAPKKQPERDLGAGLTLLGLLQREGRLVDFLKQDVTDFSDADIGAAARVVHEGCRRVLDAQAKIEPIRPEAEGASLKLDADFDALAIKLTGNVAGSAPYRGVLRHRGWRATRFELPSVIEGHDTSVLAPAEVEL